MKQFIIKLEWEPSFDRMTDEQRGIMLKVFFDYHNGRELNFKEDVLVEALWLNMIPNIDRMNEKYMASVNNGKLGGRPKKTQTKPNNNLTKPNTNQTDTLKEKVKEKEKEEVKVKEEVKEKEKLKVDFTWQKKDYIQAWKYNKRTFCDGVEITSDNVDELFEITF